MIFNVRFDISRSRRSSSSSAACIESSGTYRDDRVSRSFRNIFILSQTSFVLVKRLRLLKERLPLTARAHFVLVATTVAGHSATVYIKKGARNNAPQQMDLMLTIQIGG
jgi:hypothetical protein